MLPASNRGAGQNLAFPDVCNTPAGPATVPIPYPNIAMNAQAASFSMTVKVSMMNALNLSSVIPMTNGDQAGVAHPTIMGSAKYTMGNPIVFVDKQPAICLLCPTTGNYMHAPLGAVLVPSAVNVFYTLAPEANGEAPSGVEEARSRCARLERAGVSARLEGGTLALRIDAFSADVVRKVYAATREIEWTSASAIEIDLRDNPGGELSAAVDLAAEFLPEGALVAEVVDADGDRERLTTSRPPRFDNPVRILVNQGTASAAEVFAAAMQREGRAVIVGTRTYGKMIATGLGAGGFGHVLSIVDRGPGGIEPDDTK